MNLNKSVSVLFTVVIIATLTACAIQPAPRDVSNGDRISIETFAGELEALADPRASIWSDLPKYSVQLLQAPPVHQSITLKTEAKPAIGTADFRIARDAGRLYIWLNWQDPSENNVNAFDQFSDAAAVQFALGDPASTSHMMGSVDAPVNIWYWKASTNKAQNLTASGFGTTRELGSEHMTSNSNWDRGHWTLVISHPIDNGGEAFHAALDHGADIPLAFAIWQGQDNNRDGFKRTSTGWIIATSN